MSRSYTPLVSDQTAQNYDALIFGDVISTYVYRPQGGRHKLRQVMARVAVRLLLR